MKKLIYGFFILALAWGNAALAEGPVVIDVRTSQEFSAGHLKGALNIDFFDEKLEDHLQKLDKNKEYELYCRSGNRSKKTLAVMKKLGFSKVKDLGAYNDLKATRPNCPEAQC